MSVDEQHWTGSASEKPIVGLRGYKVADPEKAASRRREILHAAARVFGTRGYHMTTTDDIAREIGGTKGVVYYHFRSKEEIFLELMCNAITAASERPGSPTERLRLAISTHLTNDLDPEQESYYAMLAAHDLRALSPENAATVRELQRDYRHRFAALIQEGIDDGSVEPGDAEVMALTILGAIGRVFDWFRPSGRLSREAVVDEVARLLCNSIARR